LFLLAAAKVASVGGIFVIRQVSCPAGAACAPRPTMVETGQYIDNITKGGLADVR
jgi:hypothetical protein